MSLTQEMSTTERLWLALFGCYVVGVGCYLLATGLGRLDWAAIFWGAFWSMFGFLAIPAGLFLVWFAKDPTCLDAEEASDGAFDPPPEYRGSEDA